MVIDRLRIRIISALPGAKPWISCSSSAWAACWTGWSGTWPGGDSATGMAVLLFQGAEQLPAGLLAAAAGLLADPAVRHVRGVPRALVAAALADGDTGLQQRPGDMSVVLRLAGHDPHRGGADIGAVEAQPDALDHLGQVLLAQVGLGVGNAGIGAVAERVDGGGQHTGVGIQSTGVGV